MISKSLPHRTFSCHVLQWIAFLANFYLRIGTKLAGYTSESFYNSHFVHGVNFMLLLAFVTDVAEQCRYTDKVIKSWRVEP